MTKTSQPLNYAESLQNFCASVLENNAKVTVYSNNYQAAHIRALQNIYLTVQLYLEPKIFSALALVYVQHYPPTQWDLNIYGEHFPKLLAAQTQSGKAKEADWTLLAMIAHIEHTISRAYYGYIEKDEQVPGYDKTVENSKEYLSLLSKQHPYISIADNLDINKALVIRCADTKIYIDNGTICVMPDTYWIM